MPYCDVADIVENLSETKTKMLSNDADASRVDETVVLKCIEKSASLIDGYLRGRYEVPVEENQDERILKDLNIELAVIDLHERRGKLAPELIKERKTKALERLHLIQRGVILISVVEKPVNHRVSMAVSVPKQKFTSDFYSEMP
ncbi:MAG: DUF1320 domain-containing protein [Candidatus Kapabacteria bacterium]|nr:DUF1320 domain-containing protein [Candidatus Kapabacteria bacterium]